MPRHFLKLQDLSAPALHALIERALQLKQNLHQPDLTHRTLLLLFEKPSTRTRLSFSAAMHQTGGYCIDLRSSETQLGRGETIADFARVAGSMVDVVAMRTHSQQRLEEFADHCGVSVINALSDLLHPCQLLADLLTLREEFGSLKDLDIAWVGDGNNMLNSWLEASAVLGFKLRYACPDGYQPDPTMAAAALQAEAVATPQQAVENACAVNTDVWTSMNQEGEETQRLQDFSGYQINEQLMAQAPKEAIFLHCLPAKRGQEVSDNMLEHSSSRVWRQAENRLHSQKALLELLLAG